MPQKAAPPKRRCPADDPLRLLLSPDPMTSQSMCSVGCQTRQRGQPRQSAEPAGHIGHSTGGIRAGRSAMFRLPSVEVLRVGRAVRGLDGRGDDRVHVLGFGTTAAIGTSDDPAGARPGRRNIPRGRRPTR